MSMFAYFKVRDKNDKRLASILVVSFCLVGSTMIFANASKRDLALNGILVSGLIGAFLFFILLRYGWAKLQKNVVGNLVYLLGGRMIIPGAIGATAGFILGVLEESMMRENQRTGLIVVMASAFGIIPGCAAYYWILSLLIAAQTSWSRVTGYFLSSIVAPSILVVGAYTLTLGWRPGAQGWALVVATLVALAMALVGCFYFYPKNGAELLEAYTEAARRQKEVHKCVNCRRPISDTGLQMSADELFASMSPEAQAGKELWCNSCRIELCALCCVEAAAKRGLTHHTCPRCGGPVASRGALVLRL